MSVVCRWIGISISFSFTLVNSVDSIGGSWGAYVLVASRSWAIEVWSITGITISVWVVWVAVTAIAVSAIVTSVSKTVPMITIVSIRGCIGFWFSNNCRDKGKSKNGKFQHVEYELF